MNEIHFIKNLHYNGSLLCGKGAEVFMRQGDLDGACAVYSLMMMLIIENKTRYHNLTIRDSKRGYTANMRLQDTFLYGIRGLYRDGYFFDKLCEELHSCFKSKATASSYSTFNSKGEVIEKPDLHELIRKTIDAGKPVEIGFTGKSGSFGHAVVAVGYTLYMNKMQLLCLDPGFELPRNAFWNTIVEVDLDFNNKKYSDHVHWPNGGDKVVEVDEILIID